MCKSPVSRKGMGSLSHVAGVESKWSRVREAERCEPAGPVVGAGEREGTVIWFSCQNKSYKAAPMLRRRCPGKCPLSQLLPSDSVN